MNARPKLVLASASPRRLELLRQLGLEPEVIAPDIPEAFDHGEPAEQALRLARAKARAVSEQLPGDRLVIAADTVVNVAGIPLGKPQDGRDALRMLGLLAGRRHEVLTGVSVVQGAEALEATASTQVTFRAVAAGELQAYVRTGEPLDKAGAYGIQGLGGLFVEEIRGDYSNVVGLPLGLTIGLCARIRNMTPLEFILDSART